MLAGVEDGEAGAEAGQVGVDFDRAAVEDEEGLEDALGGVGSPCVGHAAIVASSAGPARR
jgi:hypothetical protein